MIRTKVSKPKLRVGEYIDLSWKQYDKLLEILEQGTFHTSAGTDVKIKVINEKILKGIEQVL